MKYVKLYCWLAMAVAFILALCSITSCQKYDSAIRAKQRAEKAHGVEIVKIAGHANHWVYRFETREATCLIYSGYEKAAMQCKWRKR